MLDVSEHIVYIVNIWW